MFMSLAKNPEMLKGCYRTVVSSALRCFTWGLYTNSGMNGAKVILFHPAPFQPQAVLAFLPFGFSAVLYLLLALGFQL